MKNLLFIFSLFLIVSCDQTTSTLSYEDFTGTYQDAGHTIEITISPKTITFSFEGETYFLKEIYQTTSDTQRCIFFATNENSKLTFNANKVGDQYRYNVIILIDGVVRCNNVSVVKIE